MVPTMALLDRLVFVLSWDILFGTVWHRFGIFFNETLSGTSGEGGIRTRPPNSFTL